MAIIAIVGAGMMGSALSPPLVDNGHEVRLVGSPLDDDIITALKAGHDHPRLRAPLPAVKPYFAHELGAALADVDAVALGVSSAGVRWAAEALGPELSRAPRPVLMISKGLVWENQRLNVLPDVFQAALPAQAAERVQPVGVAGPCIAGELLRRVPTSVVFTGRSQAACETWRALARGSYYFVHLEPDLVGAETCAALKNAFAMGVGFGAGVHEARGGQNGSVAYHNYESGVFAQAILEMQRVVELCGGSPRAAVGLPGTGDLMVTCNGGRTGRFGKWLGLGLSLEQAIAKMEGATLECLEILRELDLALQSWDASGATRPEELPLLRHLADVALRGAAVAMPFERFGG
ncbi:MAG: glycerol-3-phosphate dehydrogenase [Myxococcales bacterium]|nr:MAG: glycerol-3-phosphate dehydrogenase [Myxococcales bacterium]